MVPNRQLLISMTFLTVCEAIQFPAVARESVATMMPPWKRKASVVVPWAILIGQSGFEWSSVAARSQAEGWFCGLALCSVPCPGLFDLKMA